jgi:hypothetical protein
MLRIFILKIALLISIVFPLAGYADAKFETNSITPNFLVVYFHSYGANYLEPYLKPNSNENIAKALLKDIPGVAIQTMDRDSIAALNGSDGFKPVTELISKDLEKYASFKHIILCGTSLGAYESIAYLHYAPQHIFDKISGIISCEPSDDLGELYWKTHSLKVRQLLLSAFSGDPNREPDYYRTHGIKTLYSGLPDRPQVRVCVISAIKDTVVPPAQQQRLCTTLRNKQFLVNFVQIDCNHCVPDAIVYGTALHRVTGR